ncbi:MAG: tyrosine-type recombinase/integrase [[Eubacterium] saphenum]|nr:tyrosine-type recombinase/integrase [[Eubacterium] saphenum]
MISLLFLLDVDTYILKRILPAFGHLRMEQIGPEHINAFMDMLRQDGVRVDGVYVCRVDFKQFIKDNDICQQKLCDAAGIGTSTLDKLCKDGRVSKVTAKRLCDAMEISVETLFEPEALTKPLSAKTLLHHFRLLRSMFEKAVKWNIVYNNPCDRVDPPKLKRKEARYLNEDEAIQLMKALDNAPSQYRMMVYLMICTGARRGEICGLEWDDVNWESGKIHIRRNSLYLPEKGMYEDTPKTESSDRIVSISDSVMKMLREFKEEQDRTKAIMGEAWEEHNKLFTQFRGKPIHPLTITKWLAKFCKDNGLPHTTPHMLRHTSATLLLMQGLPLKAVSKRLGHAQLSTTGDIYGHSLSSVDEIAADALDNMLNPSDKLRRKCDDDSGK